MILLFGVVLGILAGYIGKGRLFGFAVEGAVRGIWLPVAAFGAKLALRPLSGWIPDGWLVVVSGILTYGLTGLFFLFNRKYRGGACVGGAGLLCNLLVMAVNGFRMPVSPSVLQVEDFMAATGGQVEKLNYFIAQPDTPLLFLGDIFYCPWPVVQGFFSVGDILLALGVGMLIFAIMRKARP